MILVIDFENTCEEGRPKGFPSDIIEIGAVWATPKGEALDTLRVVVQTKTPITPFCAGLTGISQSDVDAGLTYPAAMQALAEFGAKYPSTEWASWGVSDRHSLEIDCEKHSVENPLSGWTHRNLKKEFVKARRAKPQMGLAKALEIAGLEMDGRHHSALPDALNTVKMVGHIAAACDMRDSLFCREKARREALWSLENPKPGQREQALKTLELIDHLDRRSPIGDGTKLIAADLRKSVRIVPASPGVIAHVIELEIPQPWRERFQQASAGSTKASKDTAYAHDWLNFLDLWDKENDYQKI